MRRDDFSCPVPVATTNPETIDFPTHGAQLFRGELTGHLAVLEAAIATLPSAAAGIRIHGVASLGPLLATDGGIGRIAAGILGRGARPVRAVLFNKTAATNWSLAWHQDRTICVKAKREVPGFGPWSVKGGLTHVAPPLALLSRMVTVRAHLDDVPVGNAPLLVAPGSHRMGRIRASEAEAAAGRCGTLVCLAEAGDIWLYATPILHASEAAVAPARRRVLQVDFVAEALPEGLEWLGV